MSEYMTARQVQRGHYGRTAKCLTWLWRLMKSDPDFPRPIYIGGTRYFRRSEIEAYDNDPKRRKAPKLNAEMRGQKNGAADHPTA